MAQWAKVLSAKAENGLHSQDPHGGKTEPTPHKVIFRAHLLFVVGDHPHTVICAHNIKEQK